MRRRDIFILVGALSFALVLAAVMMAGQVLPTGSWVCAAGETLPPRHRTRRPGRISSGTAVGSIPQACAGKREPDAGSCTTTSKTGGRGSPPQAARNLF